MKRTITTYGGHFERFIATLTKKELLDMETNDHKIRNYSVELSAQYGAPGTPERAKFDEEAYAFYTSQILLDARKNAHLTQKELAERIGADKSYVSRIEKGLTVPSVATFYRILNVLGLRIDINPAI